MSEKKPTTGMIGWFDLTVPDATRVREFYQQVVGWHSQAVDMGGYEDFSMIPPGGKDAVAGICHARGSNADMPPSWLPYINVANLDESLAQCSVLGGEAVTQVRDMGSYGRMCVIRDPAGAVVALMEPPPEKS
jgi:hypothetical protein